MNDTEHFTPQSAEAPQSPPSGTQIAAPRVAGDPPSFHLSNPDFPRRRPRLVDTEHHRLSDLRELSQERAVDRRRSFRRAHIATHLRALAVAGQASHLSKGAPVEGDPHEGDRERPGHRGQ